MKIEWSIKQISAVDGPNPQTIHCLSWNVVISGHYNGISVTTTQQGQTAIPYNGNETFVPFNEVADDQLKTWLFASMGEDQRNEIIQRLFAQHGADVINKAGSLPTPWTIEAYISE